MGKRDWKAQSKEPNFQVGNLLQLSLFKIFLYVACLVAVSGQGLSHFPFGHLQLELWLQVVFLT